MKRTGSYDDWHIKKMKDRDLASRYLSEVAKSSPHLFGRALLDVARARGVSHTAKMSNISRETLYRLANPSFETVRMILNSAGIGISFHACKSGVLAKDGAK